MVSRAMVSSACRAHHDARVGQNDDVAADRARQAPPPTGPARHHRRGRWNDRVRMSTLDGRETLLSEVVAALRHHVGALPLTHGWLPVAAQMVAASVLCGAVGWRTPRWRGFWVPTGRLDRGRRSRCGLPRTSRRSASPVTRRRGHCGSGRHSPGWGLAVLVVGWRRDSLVAPLACRCWRYRCACSGCVLALNRWVGYFPTVRRRVGPAHRRARCPIRPTGSP